MICIRHYNTADVVEVNPLAVAYVYFPANNAPADVVMHNGHVITTYHEDAELVSDAVAAITHLTPENVRAALNWSPNSPVPTEAPND